MTLEERLVQQPLAHVHSTIKVLAMWGLIESIPWTTGDRHHRSRTTSLAVRLRSRFPPTSSSESDPVALLDRSIHLFILIQLRMHLAVKRILINEKCYRSASAWTTELSESRNDYAHLRVTQHFAKTTKNYKLQE
ncbi:hypothetical protein T265_07996 [Opisthorchis viverrini]|uniref:Uncharacterized protein n=1 Tax=Opisthorchis viverrini TaxID=6198 RepID=A0A074ZLS2_OPIVI|nr:hypothetical protein T265_07996 [Opisthorchis viverrini]KER24310.1 hypothetical protein T265_07996 [Opisthorchis viverrini]